MCVCVPDHHTKWMREWEKNALEKTSASQPSNYFLVLHILILVLLRGLPCSYRLCLKLLDIRTIDSNHHRKQSWIELCVISQRVGGVDNISRMGKQREMNLFGGKIITVAYLFGYMFLMLSEVGCRSRYYILFHVKFHFAFQLNNEYRNRVCDTISMGQLMLLLGKLQKSMANIPTVSISIFNSFLLRLPLSHQWIVSYCLRYV